MSGPPYLPPDVALDALVDGLAQRVAALIRESLPPTSDEPSPWMGVALAATYLDWPRQRLYKLTAQGAIPHYKHEGRLLFRRDELDHWLARYASSERLQ